MKWFGHVTQAAHTEIVQIRSSHARCGSHGRFALAEGPGQTDETGMAGKASSPRCLRSVIVFDLGKQNRVGGFTACP